MSLHMTTEFVLLIRNTFGPQHMFTVQASVAAAMATGVANRVLYKMALVPMGNYVFVLSQFQTFGYLLVYFGILAARYK